MMSYQEIRILEELGERVLEISGLLPRLRITAG